ncbi:flagellar basal body L-ring protein FlgH [Kangiella sp. HZ709]|uniref:flagellar basal body L-ring protein FlgH n=1 Tax=Kangiella sp. HZ709 TaxID=2666328 RepID=UPI0012AFF1AF|nr:flagellar basal body L-ring protein FlgH [Kangiella sp. HZ709]MRX26855.1 flagellar basal body L-ring protein FlgH [Kangiella sp. HZ709]
MKNKVLILFLIVFMPISLAENLYQEDRFKSLVADRKATQVGDLITLVVVEASKAESQAGTGRSRDTSIGLDAFDTTREPSFAINFDRSSDTDARTVRKGFLQAQISVTIIDKTPAGNYIVEGKQVLNINNEEQIIGIKGVLRPEDINSKNVALSNRLAEAEITFTGEGTVGDDQGKGIIQTILGWLGIL